MYDLGNRDYPSKIYDCLIFEIVILGHYGVRNIYFHFFKVALELFRKCLGIVFGLKRPTFGRLVSAKGPKMTSKFDDFSIFERVILGNFGVQKTSFGTFSKLFWTCLGSV